MKTILIVDDTVFFREPIAAILRKRGYQTVCAGDGREALARLESDAPAPDLILLDMAMPAMDGPTFLRHIRGIVRWSKTPVIMLTALPEKDCRETLSDLRVDDFMMKSHFSLEDLVQRVGIHLNGNEHPGENPGSCPC